MPGGLREDPCEVPCCHAELRTGTPPLDPQKLARGLTAGAQCVYWVHEEMNEAWLCPPNKSFLFISTPSTFSFAQTEAMRCSSPPFFLLILNRPSPWSLKNYLNFRGTQLLKHIPHCRSSRRTALLFTLSLPVPLGEKKVLRGGCEKPWISTKGPVCHSATY